MGKIVNWILLLCIIGAFVGFTFQYQTANWAYRAGDIICVKLTHEQGQITHVYGSLAYSVRLAANAAGTYPQITFQEYELEPCK